jgi:hypothetical protein
MEYVLEKIWLAWNERGRSMAGPRGIQLPAALAKAGLALWERRLLEALQPACRGRVLVKIRPMGRLR